ncbi:hypothetical protein HanPI659440_Chr14g0559401 [Helianthus annuus]|nr:hypothetical protein HanPI659440_Chr14g0559401 [Helianthus annuus]
MQAFNQLPIQQPIISIQQPMISPLLLGGCVGPCPGPDVNPVQSAHNAHTVPAVHDMK